MDSQEHSINDGISDLSEWQKKEIRKRIEKYRDNNELFIDKESFFKFLDEN